MILPPAVVRRRLACEQGFGLVEVMTGAILLAVGLVATLSAFDSAGKLGYSAQLHEEAVVLAQQEVERIKALPFGKVMLNAPQVAQPADDATNPSDPRAYVSGDQFRILENYHDAESQPIGSGWEPLLVDAASGAVDPTSEVTLGDGQATVYRFITERDERCVVNGSDRCDGGDSIRITVAVVLAPPGNGAGPAKPLYASTVVMNPDMAPLEL